MQDKNGHLSTQESIRKLIEKHGGDVAESWATTHAFCPVQGQ
jgi:hypothetical protein